MKMKIVQKKAPPKRIAKAKSKKPLTLIRDELNKWPIWDDKNNFRTKNFHFTCSVVDYTGNTTKNQISLLKDRTFIDQYQMMIAQLKPKRVFEIGFFQGGMPLFLCDVSEVEKVLAVDWNPPNEYLKDIIKRHNLSKRVELVGNVDQANSAGVKEIMDKGFKKEAVDLIIDDCSHYYQNTKGCFERLFSSLRPGGAYMIEDWGWTHWPVAPWNTPESHFHGMPSMTNLMFEITMAFASTRDVIDRIEFPSWSSMVIYRGKKLAHGEYFDLSKHIQVHGGRNAQLITEPTPGTAAPKTRPLEETKQATRKGFLSMFQKNSPV
jgi:cephalosporin hydroxylase